MNNEKKFGVILWGTLIDEISESYADHVDEEIYKTMMGTNE